MRNIWNAQQYHLLYAFGVLQDNEHIPTAPVAVDAVRLDFAKFYWSNHVVQYIPLVHHHRRL